MCYILCLDCYRGTETFYYFPFWDASFTSKEMFINDPGDTRRVGDGVHATFGGRVRLGS